MPQEVFPISYLSHQQGGTPSQSMVGLDVGDVRIGVAASDGLGITAQGLPTITRETPPADLDQVIRVITERGATRLVVGWPKNMDGSIGFQGGKTQDFVEALLTRIRETGAPEPEVVYWDERLTTVAANRALLEGGLSRKKRKKAVDQVAAVLILQGYMDMQR